MRTIAWKKIGLGLLALSLFILAIQLMKEGAGMVAPFIQGWFDVDNAANSLGLGWLGAYVTLSGSPVAAAALAFFDANAIGPYQAFTMLTGSRLGASLIVLAVGFLYVLRGHERPTGLSMGLLTFIITAFLHLPGLAVGYLVLRSPISDTLHLSGGASLMSLIDLIYGPITNFVRANLPGWLVFAIGMGVILTSFSLFDRALPDLRLKTTEFGAIPRLIYRPSVMFLMGLVITALSMSVAVSITILVPLSARGYIRTENAIAYIMGANVSTFLDTLMVALLLDNPLASTVVLAQMISIVVVSFPILAFLYGPYERILLSLTSAIVGSNRNLAIFVISILVAPIALMVF